MSSTGTLEVSTPTEREIVMTRVFDAPRELIFDALTNPETLKRWFGPPGWSLAACEVDLTVGGAWRHVMCRADGTELEMRGVYREIAPPERLVYTETYDQPGWGELLVTAVLVEQAGKTTLSTTVLHPSREVRDANSGMAEGVAASFDRLAGYLAPVA